MKTNNKKKKSSREISYNWRQAQKLAGKKAILLWFSPEEIHKLVELKRHFRIYNTLAFAPLIKELLGTFHRYVSTEDNRED